MQSMTSFQETLEQCAIRITNDSCTGNSNTLLQFLNTHVTSSETADIWLDSLRSWLEKNPHSLIPCLRPLENTENNVFSMSRSFIQICLMHQNLQAGLLTLLLDYLVPDDVTNTDLPKLILKQWTWLPCLYQPESFMKSIFELFSILPETVQQEMILLFPDLIPESCHVQLTEFLLAQEKTLMPVVLDVMQQLQIPLEGALKEKIMEQLRVCDALLIPHYISYLLQSSEVNLNLIQNMASLLDLSSLLAMAESKGTQSLDVLIMDKIKNSLHVWKECWIKYLKQSQSWQWFEWLLVLLLPLEARTSLCKQAIRKRLFSSSTLHQVIQQCPYSALNSECFILAEEWMRQSFSLEHASVLYEALMKWNATECVTALMTHVTNNQSALERETSLDLLLKMSRTESMIQQLAQQHGNFMSLTMVCSGVQFQLSQWKKVFEIISRVAFHSNGLMHEWQLTLRKQLMSHLEKTREMGLIGTMILIGTCLLQENNRKDCIEMAIEWMKLAYYSPTSKLIFYQELSCLLQEKRLHETSFIQFIHDDITSDFEEIYISHQNDIIDDTLTWEYNLDGEMNEIGLILFPLVQASSNSNNTSKGGIHLMPVMLKARLICEKILFQSLNNVDALLGCPILMSKHDLEAENESHDRCLFYACCWWRELLNAFVDQENRDELKIFQRFQLLVEQESHLENCKLKPKEEHSLSNQVIQFILSLPLYCTESNETNNNSDCKLSIESLQFLLKEISLNSAFIPLLTNHLNTIMDTLDSNPEEKWTQIYYDCLSCLFVQVNQLIEKKETLSSSELVHCMSKSCRHLIPLKTRILLFRFIHLLNQPELEKKIRNLIWDESISNDDETLNATDLQEFLKLAIIGRDGDVEQSFEHLKVVINEWMTALCDENDLESFSLPFLSKFQWKQNYHLLHKLVLERLIYFCQLSNQDLSFYSNVTVCFHSLLTLPLMREEKNLLLNALRLGKLFVDSFIAVVMPCLDRHFKSHRVAILALLRQLQQGTRALHAIVSHVKLIVSLTRFVPPLKKSLEMLLVRVKVMLETNQVGSAFWLGNLKHRSIRGEQVYSQMVRKVDQSDESDKSNEENNDENKVKQFSQPKRLKQEQLQNASIRAVDGTRLQENDSSEDD